MLFPFLTSLALMTGLSFSKEDCNVDDSVGPLAPLSSIQRRIIGSGFHRKLVTALEVTWSDTRACRLAVLETIPVGVYVDPDELRRFTSHDQHVWRGVNAGEGREETWRVLYPPSVDIEAMAHRVAASHAMHGTEQARGVDSGAIRLLIWPRFNTTTTTIESASEEATVLPSHGQKYKHKSRLVLPIHGRYHSAEYDHQYVHITIEPPQLYYVCDGSAADVDTDTQCSPIGTIQLPCTNHANSMLCLYHPINSENAATVTVQLPVGDLDDLELVLVGTTLSVIAGSVLLLIVIHGKRLS